MDDLMRIEKAAARLNITTSTLYRWVEQRKISHRRIGSLIYFSEEDLTSVMQVRPAAPVKKSTAVQRHAQRRKLPVRNIA